MADMVDMDAEDANEAVEHVKRWAGGLTDAQIEEMSDDMAKGAAQIVGFASVLGKIKNAQTSGLSHVVLKRDEVDHLLHGLRLLTTRKPKS